MSTTLVYANEEENLNTHTIRESLLTIGSTLTFEEKEKEVQPVMAKITTYGVDCYGCYNENGFGGTAGGIKVSTDAVKQSDGTWKQGITYDGYYIVATNQSIPFGTIVEVSNHGYLGYGLQPGVPFQAIVMDRGAMGVNHIDLFVGSEKNNAMHIDRSFVPTMKIIRMGF